jgi:hypothetical protein
MIGISRREVAKLAVVETNSVQNWRNLYIKVGIEGLIHLERIIKFNIIKNHNYFDLYLY